MKKEIGGKTYVPVKAEQDGSCAGYAAQRDDGLCEKLHTNEYGEFTPDICTSVNEIFKEQTMSEKTALELVDGLIAMMGCPPPGQLIKLKSAIEREQDGYKRLLDTHDSIMEEQKLKLESAIVMRPISEELQQRDGDTTHILSNILRNWSPEKQKSLVRGIVGESMIVMRPISELPDKVPDGCVIVVITSEEVWWTRGAGRPLKDDRWGNYATHFYIIPLPKPARRLHPCYMPGCGNEVVVLRDGEDGYRVECRKCGSTGPLRASKEGAEQSWGYAE